MRFVRRINERGSVTLPSEIRKLMNIQDGDYVELEVRNVARAPETEVTA